MERTRLRELTLFILGIEFHSAVLVEMERTRLRELTQHIRVLFNLFFCCRNGAYPIKGIDTN